MKLEKIIDFLNKAFPPSNAVKEDVIGLLVKGDLEVKNILVSLDLTLDVISQALEKKINLIISHHPIYWGDFKEAIKKDKFIEAKFELLKKANINWFVIHTNADFSKDSIAKRQADILELKNIKQMFNNNLVYGELKEEKEIDFIVKEIKEKLDLDYPIKTNILMNEKYKNIFICSGSCAEILEFNIPKDRKNLFLIGELKHHNWVYANEHFLSVVETGHFSEKIFKNIIKEKLSSLKDINIILAEEINGYQSI